MYSSPKTTTRVIVAELFVAFLVGVASVHAQPAPPPGIGLIESNSSNADATTSVLKATKRLGAPLILRRSPEIGSLEPEMAPLPDSPITRANLSKPRRTTVQQKRVQPNLVQPRPVQPKPVQTQPIAPVSVTQPRPIARTDSNTQSYPRTATPLPIHPALRSSGGQAMTAPLPPRIADPRSLTMQTPVLPDRQVQPASYSASHASHNPPSIPSVSQPIMQASYVSAGCDAAGANFGATTCCCNKHCICGTYVPPLGSAVDSYFDAQIYNGQRAQHVLYHYDFHNGPNEDQSRLNVAGRKKLARMIHSFEAMGHPLVVQSVRGRPELAAARKAQVLGFLQGTLGVPVSDDQIVVGEPDYLGLRGVEAVLIDRNQLQNTISLGALGGRSSGSGNSGTSRGTGSQGNQAR